MFFFFKILKRVANLISFIKSVLYLSYHDTVQSGIEREKQLPDPILSNFVVLFHFSVW